MSSRALVALSLATLLSACGGSSPTAPTPQPAPAPQPQPTPPSQFELTGEWVRINSTFAELDGMVVQISTNGAQAVIVSTPANQYRFQVSDTKWRSIARVSSTRFSFEDLVRQAGSGATSYVAGFIEAQPGSTELSMTFPSTGTVQQWRRR
jgi:hypothetical protein